MIERKSTLFRRDYKEQLIVIIDDQGETTLNLADLPGHILTTAMVEGLIRLMRVHGDPRVCWAMWKQGVYKSRRYAMVKKKIAKKRIKKPRSKRLTLAKQAIMLALLDKPKCPSPARLEKFVHGLSSTELVTLSREPDVAMHLRRLKNEPSLRSGSLIDRIKAEDDGTIITKTKVGVQSRRKAAEEALAQKIRDEVASQIARQNRMAEETRLV